LEKNYEVNKKMNKQKDLLWQVQRTNELILVEFFNRMNKEIKNITKNPVENILSTLPENKLAPE